MFCDKYCLEQLLWSVCHCLLQAGYTALHLAASRGHLEVVRALLVASRSVNNQDKIVCVFLVLFWKLYNSQIILWFAADMKGIWPFVTVLSCFSLVIRTKAS